MKWIETDGSIDDARCALFLPMKLFLPTLGTVIVCRVVVDVVWRAFCSLRTPAPCRGSQLCAPFYYLGAAHMRFLHGLPLSLHSSCAHLDTRLRRAWLRRVVAAIQCRSLWVDRLHLRRRLQNLFCGGPL